MSFQLGPPDYRSYLPVDELLGRLRAEFPFVSVDREAGADHVAPLLLQGESAPAPNPGFVERLRRMRAEAVRVIVADSADSCDGHLSFVVMPESSLWIGFESETHAIASAGLVDRCCRVLGYIVSPDGAG